MLKLQTLASGSKGNCIYIATETTEILIDIGLSLPQIEERIKSARIDPDKITGVLLTHEHSDHICGVPRFLQKYKHCHVYVHSDAKDIITKILHQQKFHESARIATFDKPFFIGDIEVNFFELPHDSKFCFGYTFKHEGVKISTATDLGHISTETIKAIGGSQIVLLESNHDLGKLSANVKYPVVLKRRISGSLGHLSNIAASLAIYELAKTGVGQVILAHLSEQNNSPTLAYSFCRDFLARKGLVEGTDIFIDVADQHQVGKIYRIE